MNKIRASRFLSLVLRHNPGKIDLELDEQGYAKVTDILEKMGWTRSFLENLVTTNTKQRFAFNKNKTRIRASQGHSINVDLALTELEPPSILLHGTSKRLATIIDSEGLKKMARHHVHLSEDITTAANVGQRRKGDLLIYRVNASQMHQDGYIFYRSDNGVWLTDHVPPGYLEHSA